jgi:hypothetical protein
VGDQLEISTGVILDHNGNPVPNGTPVQFVFAYPQEGLEHTITSATREGIAKAATTLDRTGLLDISVQADPVPRTVVLQITIQESGEPIIERITPTASPTRPIPTPTASPEPEPAVENTPVPTATTAAVEPDTEAPDVNNFSLGALDLMVGLLAATVIGMVGFCAVRARNQPLSVALRGALWCFVGGLGLYAAYALRVPGAAWLQEQNGVWASGWVALLGGRVALLGGLIPLAVVWLTILRRHATKSN